LQPDISFLWYLEGLHLKYLTGHWLFCFILYWQPLCENILLVLGKEAMFPVFQLFPIHNKYSF